MTAFIRSSGLVSALGGLTTACAAHRAGLSRADGARDADCFVKGDSEPAPVSAHAAPLVTFGFTGVGRLTVLLAEAFRDLFDRVGPGQIPPDAPVFLALPDPLDRPVDAAFAEAEDEDARVGALAAKVLARASAVLGREAPSGPLRAFGGGHAAVSRALAEALLMLEARKATACFVAAADSLVEPWVIQSYLDDGRLKVGDNAYGFAPGEAAAVHLLVRGQTGLPAGEAGVVVRSVTVRHEPAHRGSGRAIDGRILADCVEAVLREGAPGEVAPGRTVGLVTDHDGEPHRAQEWGHLLFQLQSRGVTVRDEEFGFPCEGFGNTGAASGALSLAVAARALARGQARASSCVVVSSDDAGPRAAVLLEPARDAGGEA